MIIKYRKAKYTCKGENKGNNCFENNGYTLNGLDTCKKVGYL